MLVYDLHVHDCVFKAGVFLILKSLTFHCRLSEDRELSNIDLPENAKTVDKVMDRVYKEYKRQLSQGTTSLNGVSQQLPDRQLVLAMSIT